MSEHHKHVLNTSENVKLLFMEECNKNYNLVKTVDALKFELAEVCYYS